MDRRDLDLCDGACWHCPRALCPLRPELYGPFSSPASRFVVSSSWLSYRSCARRGEATTRAIEQLRAEWGDKASGRLFWFLQVQAAAGLVLALVDRCSGSSARNRARSSRRTGRRAFGGCDLRRKSGGSATGPLRGRPQESVQDLRRRALGLLSPSELFFRVARLGRLRADRDRARLAIILGVGSALRRPFSCTCCLSMCPVSRRWRLTCFGRGATPSVSTRRV